MPGQLWGTAADGGYLYSDELSDVLRTTMQPRLIFRQHCDADDAKTQKTSKKGDKFYWDVIGNVATAGGELTETVAVPSTKVAVTQNSLTIKEWGLSIDYTGKLDEFSKFDIEKIIKKALANDAAKVLDQAAYDQIKTTPLVASVTTGTTSVTLDTGGSASLTNNVELGTGHIKAIVDTMKERNIPAYEGKFYRCIAHPTTFRTFKNSLETLHSYTSEGFQMILNGEIGKYENTRFFEQTYIAKESWSNNKSNWAYFFGEDVCMEGIVVEEEMRGKIPTDYGRDRGVMWYALIGFGIVHPDATNARIVKWGTAA